MPTPKLQHPIGHIADVIVKSDVGPDQNSKPLKLPYKLLPTDGGPRVIEGKTALVYRIARKDGKDPNGKDIEDPNVKDIALWVFKNQAGLDESATAEAVMQHVATLNALKEYPNWLSDSSKALIPKVLGFSENKTNNLKAPFILMEDVGAGTPADGVIKDGGDPKVIANFYNHLARFVAELASKRWNGVGPLTAKRKEGPAEGKKVLRTSDVVFTTEPEFRGFSSTESYFEQLGYWPPSSHGRDPTSDKGRGALKLARTLFGTYSPTTDDIWANNLKPSDVGELALCHPDLDLKNIFVDADGNITGIVGWMFARIEPRFVCLSRLPQPISGREFTTPRFPAEELQVVDSSSHKVIGPQSREAYLDSLKEKLNWKEVNWEKHIGAARRWDMLKSDRGRQDLVAEVIREATRMTGDRVSEVLQHPNKLDDDKKKLAKAYAERIMPLALWNEKRDEETQESGYTF